MVGECEGCPGYLVGVLGEDWERGGEEEEEEGGGGGEVWHGCDLRGLEG